MRENQGKRRLAQGATEYLVLLAVVLIIALVTIAMLTFFSETSGDVQVEESQAYWKSSSPIAVIDANAFGGDAANYALFSLVLRNNGPYPIRITKLISSTNIQDYLNGVPSGVNLSDILYLAPGEEKLIGKPDRLASYPPAYTVLSAYTSSMVGFQSALGLARTICDPSAQFYTHTAKSWGTVEYDSFGFEYIEYIEGIGISKKQFGAKPLIIKCYY